MDGKPRVKVYDDDEEEEVDDMVVATVSSESNRVRDEHRSGSVL